MNIRQRIAELLGLKEKDIPDGQNLEGFTEEQLKEAEDKARASLSELRTARNLKAFSELVDDIEIISKHRVDLETERVNQDAEMDDLESRIKVETDPPTPDPDPEPTPDPTPDPEPAPEPTPPSTEPVPAPTAETPTPVAAAATPPIVPAPSRPSPNSTSPVTLVAAGDVEGHSAGSSITIDDLGPAFVTKSKSIKSARAEGRFGVATLSWEYPEERFLQVQDSEQANTEKIMNTVQASQDRTRDILKKMTQTSDAEELTVLTAEGGLCAPVNVRYDIFTVGTDRRPLRDSLTRFGATRGGIRFNRPPVLTDVDGSANVYTEEQDTTGYDYPKDCIRVDCGADVVAEVSAISLCMEVGNYNRLFFRENFDAWWKLGRVGHARLAEETIWDALVGHADAVSVTAAQDIGAARFVPRVVARAAAQYRDRHRVDPETPLRLHAPDWLVTLMQTDLFANAPGDDNLGATRAQVARYFAAFNIATTFVLDGQAAGTSRTQADSAALNAFPTDLDLLLSVDGTLLFLDGGDLNFGTEIRDWDQIRNNDSGAFFETFEQVANVGPDFLHIDISSLCADGSTAGDTATPTC